MSKKRVQFALAAPIRQEGDYFIRTGKFFECDRPFTDMNGVEFSISQAEADTILPAFTGGSLNIEHMPTLFTEKHPGKLGSVRHLWREGNDVVGDFAVHKDIHNFFEGVPLEISSEWDIATKTPLGAALVVNPAVHDAVMMAAFAAVKCSPLMQEHHDLACRQGAECAGKAMFADAGIVLDYAAIKMMKPEELAAVQAAHDHASGSGASCDLYKTKKSMYYKQSAMQTLQETGIAGKGRVMSAFDKLKALFRRAGASDEEIDEGIKELTATGATTAAQTQTEAKAPASFAESPEYKAMMARQDALLKQNEVLAEGLNAQHVQFAEQARAALFASQCAKIDAQVGRKLTPAAAERWKQTAQANPAAFADIFDDVMKETPVIRQFAGARPSVNVAGSSESAGEQLAKMAAEKAKADGTPLHVAMSAVVSDPKNASLAAAHADSVRPIGAEGA